MFYITYVDRFGNPCTEQHDTLAEALVRAAIVMAVQGQPVDVLNSKKIFMCRVSGR
jgi:hypothetical protein